MRSARYAPADLLALDPKAFGRLFAIQGSQAAETSNGVAVVKIRGPLMHHEDWCFDSYAAIKSRVSLALESRPAALVLAIDSPGGLVSGCFETARELRAMAEASSVPLVAYVDGQATSAAYALACAAEHIVAPPTGMIGSIGVVSEILDTSAQDAMLGVSFRAVTSGARKADGNPHVPTSDETVAAVQRTVDSLAGIFVAWVAETRPITSDEVFALEAGIFPGIEAEAHGLVDEIASLEELLTRLSGGGTVAPATSTTEDAMASDYEEGLAKLRKAAEGDDENAKAARKMLAALEDDSEETAEGEKETPEEPKDNEGKAEGDEEKPDEAKAAAAAASIEERLDRMERAQIMASRQDLTDAQRSALASVPVSALGAALSAIPRSTKKPAAAATVPVTRGAGQGEGSVSRLAPDAKAELDRRMGLVAMKPGVVEQGNKLVLGASVPTTGKGA